jgi:hypothetical protein
MNSTGTSADCFSVLSRLFYRAAGRFLAVTTMAWYIRHEHIIPSCRSSATTENRSILEALHLLRCSATEGNGSVPAATQDVLVPAHPRAHAGDDRCDTRTTCTWYRYLPREESILIAPGTFGICDTCVRNLHRLLALTPYYLRLGNARMRTPDALECSITTNGSSTGPPRESTVTKFPIVEFINQFVVPCSQWFFFIAKRESNREPYLRISCNQKFYKKVGSVCKNNNQKRVDPCNESDRNERRWVAVLEPGWLSCGAT